MNSFSRRFRLSSCAILMAGALSASTGVNAHGQAPEADPSERLRQVLPSDVAERVLSRIAAARAQQLPAEALEQRALKFAARGVAPSNIERSVAEQADRMVQARSALQRARPQQPSGDEVEAGAEALRVGVDGAAVAELAASAPSGRSLAVPLYVVGSLVARGLPSDEALSRVQARLIARASDADLEQLPAQAGERNDRPAGAGQRGIGRPAGVGGPPAGVPARGAGARPPAAGVPVVPGLPGRP